MKPRKAPLKRTPLKSGKPPERKTPLRVSRVLSNSTQTRRPNGPVKARKVAKPGAAAAEREGRRLVAARSGGLCEVCALAVAREWHHRQNRSQGGTWAASNGMHLCRWDHQWITEHPEQSYRNGWSVRSGHDPAAVPVLRRGKRVLLDDEGRIAAFTDAGAPVGAEGGGAPA